MTAVPRVSDRARLPVARRLAAAGAALLLLVGCESSPAATQPPLTPPPRPTVEAMSDAPGTPARDAGGSVTVRAATRAPGEEVVTDQESTATASPRADVTPAVQFPPPPATSGGPARDGGVTGLRPEQPQPTPTAYSRVDKGAARPDPSTQGQEYTWRDGDRAHRVRLAADLVVQRSSANTAGDVVARDDGETSVVQKQPRHEGMDTEPVFRSQGGDLMTLPGGVLLALDAAWDDARVARFFSDNGIGGSRVQGRDFAVNAFLVETELGFPSLDLANRLAGQDGVLISSPNWRTEVSLR